MMVWFPKRHTLDDLDETAKQILEELGSVLEVTKRIANQQEKDVNNRERERVQRDGRFTR